MSILHLTSLCLNTINSGWRYEVLTGFAGTFIAGLWLGTDTNRTFFSQIVSVNFQKQRKRSKNFLLVVFTWKEHLLILQRQVPLFYYVKAQNVLFQLA